MIGLELTAREKLYPPLSESLQLAPYLAEFEACNPSEQKPPGSSLIASLLPTQVVHYLSPQSSYKSRQHGRRTL